MKKYVIYVLIIFALGLIAMIGMISCHNGGPKQGEKHNKNEFPKKTSPGRQDKVDGAQNRPGEKQEANQEKTWLKSISLPGKIGKMEKQGTAEYYTENSLINKIDGEADLFIRYGYKNSFFQEYKGDSDHIEIQIFDMDKLLNAFGIFSVYTNQYGSFVSMGSKGFEDENAFIFYRGKYFVKILLLKGSRENLKTVASLIDKRIPDKPRQPKEIQLFPQEGLVRHTLRYIPKSLLGRSFMPGGFEAYYKKGATRFKVFITFFENPGETSKAREKIEKHKKNIIIIQEKNILVGAVEYKNPEKTKQKLQDIINGIRKSGQSF